MAQAPIAHRSKASVSLPALLAFESVARHMNFSRAAAEVDVTPTAMSRTVKNLEAQLGVRLFNRTTRSVGITESGSQLLDMLAPALEQIRRSVQQVGEASSKPRGLLRINTSYVAYATLLQPHLRQFLSRFPDITLDVAIDNLLSDIVAAGFDAGIRLGHALQRDMIGVPIGPMQRLVVVGSPSYLKARGTPLKPPDLLNHDCIRQRIGGHGQFMQWEFKSGAKTLSIDVTGRSIFTEMRCALDAATQGNGLAFVFEHFAAPALRSGKLVTVLDRYGLPGEAFHLYYPNRQQMPGKVRALIEFVRAVNWEVPG